MYKNNPFLIHVGGGEPIQISLSWALHFYIDIKLNAILTGEAMQAPEDEDGRQSRQPPEGW